MLAAVSSDRVRAHSASRGALLACAACCGQSLASLAEAAGNANAPPAWAVPELLRNVELAMPPDLNFTISHYFSGCVWVAGRDHRALCSVLRVS